MTLKAAIYAYLAAQTGLTALVSTRIYPRRRPQGSDLPAVTFYFSSRVPTGKAMGTTHALTTAWVTTDAWGETDLSVTSVVLQLKAALQRYSGTMGGGGGVVVQDCTLDNEVDLHAPERDIFHTALDWRLWHVGES